MQLDQERAQKTEMYLWVPKRAEFLDWLSSYQLLKKDPAPWIS
jgi:hypothetical protein